LLTHQFNSVDRVNNIKAQTLVILAENDLVIPEKYSTELIKAFPVDQVKVETIANSNHNNLVSKDKYLSLLSRFLHN